MPDRKLEKVDGFDVATVDPAKLTTKDVLAVARMGGKIRLAEADGHQQAFDMLEDRVAAETAEGLFGDVGEETLKVADVIGKPFLLKAVRFQNSDLSAYPDGLGIFAVLEVMIDGQAEVITSGGGDVVMKSIRAVELGVLPRWLRITESTTKGGTKVQNLIDAPTQKPPTGPGF